MKTLSEIMMKYKDQKPRQFGHVNERQFPVSAVINIVDESVKEHTAPLIEALGEAKLQIEYLHKIFASTGSSNELLSKIKTALLNSKL